MKSIRIYDFEDSFTFNIATSFFLKGYVPLILPFEKLEDDLNDKELSQEFFVLGPGPGRPESHKHLYETLKFKILNDYKILGICLGHQIILNALGFIVRISSKPIHGFVEKVALTQNWQDRLNISSKEIVVQRYNSLEVVENSESKNKVSSLIQDGVVYAGSLNKCITYQFHPESIGTIDQDQFFEAFLKL